MTLSAGTRLGIYEVVSKLGEGGMGEVYRARDTRLQRDVALKILPAAVATDPDRLARFEREARVLASLNHPNIAQIYGLEESGVIRALVMELVAGRSLDRMIPQEGLPLDRMVEIGTSIASALTAAHAKGIVHRDLKPANVMVSEDGTVKVLDFGLAKEVRATSPGEATFTSAGQTAIGIIMGTPAYMSPEQVAGRPVDHRSDIFALGVQLYEMATGSRPFAGASSAELASAILRDTPSPVTELRTDLPLDLARIIRRCLEKDPRDRLQTAHDVVIELRDLAKHGSGPSKRSEPAPGRAGGGPGSGAARTDEGFWVAVLPFAHQGADTAIPAFTDGLTEEIVTGLSRFSYLRVIAHGATRRYAGTAADAMAAGRALNARYVMSGSVRQAGASLRVSAQLVDTESGANVWAETYTREFRAETAFAVQDDLVPRIVSTVADNYGVLMHSMSEALRHRAPEELTPYEAVLRGYGYYERINAEEHREVRNLLEQVVERAPGNSDCHRLLATLYADEFRSGFNPLPDPLGRALAAGRRAVETGPSNGAAHIALAVAHFFRKERTSFRSEVERALTLNPFDGGTMAFAGVLLAFDGEWERGCALAARARELNPHHPGWFWFATCIDAYRRREYGEALQIASKFNLPGHPFASVSLAASCGQVGDTRAGREAVTTLLALNPGFATRQELGKWFDENLVEHLVEGLRKAGLDVDRAEPYGPVSAAVPTSGSGPVRAANGFWIAVLPFTHRGSDAAVETLAEGLSDEIVTGLSRFSYLRVIARSSTKRFLKQAVDVRDVGRELGARYVMTGSLRQAGPSLRLSIELIDAETGAHLWAETYNRRFDPVAVFELQDDLVPRVVSAIADMSGVLPHSMSEALRTRDVASLSPYEAVLRGLGALRRLTAEEHGLVRDALERAVRSDESNADCWATLSWTYVSEYSHGFNTRPGSLDRALDAARRAVDAAPSNSFAHNALAQALFFRRELTPFRTAAERAMALNPMDALTVAYMGILLAYAGEWDRGCALAAKAMELNPNHPGWYRFANYFNTYRRGEYGTALEAALNFDMPHYFYTYAALAAAYGQVGDRSAAADAVAKLLSLKPEFATDARAEYEKWFGAGDLVERLLEGLRKAGLDVKESG